MQITEIRIKLVENRSDRLKAFCSLTFDDDFVVRDLKIIEGVNGYFIAMPSRKLTDHCPRCSGKNHLRAKFCNNCGRRLKTDRIRRRGRGKIHADIAHPINTTSREMIQTRIVSEFHKEIERAKQPGYIPTSMDDLDQEYHKVATAPKPSPSTDHTPSQQEVSSPPTSSIQTDPQEQHQEPPPPDAPPAPPDKPETSSNDTFGEGIF